MTKQTILDAVREELLSTNKLCSLGDGFSETDYTCLGMVSAALDKVDFDAAREDEAVGFAEWDEQYMKDPPLGELPSIKYRYKVYHHLKHKNEKK